MQMIYKTHCQANYCATKYIKIHLLSKLFIIVAIIGWRLVPTDSNREKYLYQTASFIIHYQYKLKKIYALLRCPLVTIQVTIVPVQQQIWVVDCCLFAIAFLHFLLSCKQTPVGVSFAQSSMINHILKCLKNNRLELFPQTEHFKKICKKKSSNLSCIAHAVRFGSSQTMDFLISNF